MSKPKRPWVPGPRDEGFDGAKLTSFPKVGSMEATSSSAVQLCAGRSPGFGAGGKLVPCCRPTRALYGGRPLCLGCAFVAEARAAGRSDEGLLKRLAQ